MEKVSEVELPDGTKLVIRENVLSALKRDYLIGILVGDEFALHNPYGPAVVMLCGRHARKRIIAWLKENIEEDKITAPSGVRDTGYWLFGAPFIGAPYISCVFRDKSTERVAMAAIRLTHEQSLSLLRITERTREEMISTIAKVLSWDEKAIKAVRAAIILER